MKTALVLACDDKYVPFTTVVARQIVRSSTETLPPITVISDGVSDENKALATQFCPQIEFLEAAPLFNDHALPVTSAFSRAAHLRLFLDEILADFDHAVYLDSDISVLADVSPLLAMRPKSGPIIAAHDLHIMVAKAYRERLQISGPYFNSGVMVLDLKAIRAERIFAEALRYAQTYPERCEMVDQDPLNAVLDGRWQTLDWRWNAMNYMSQLLPKQPFIRHFAGCKPWAPKKVGLETHYIDQWRSDLGDSPWTGCFQQEIFKYRFRRIFKPATSTVNQFAKSWLYASSAGKRGNRARLVNDFPTILSAIERAAATDAVADSFVPNELNLSAA